MEFEEINSVYEANRGYSESKDFTSLECWKKSREVRQYFYSKVIPRLPKEEKYNLDIQIRKAAVSTTANIYPVK